MGYRGTLIAVHGSRTPTALQDLEAAVRSYEGAARGHGWRVYDVPDNVLPTRWGSRWRSGRSTRRHDRAAGTFSAARSDRDDRRQGAHGRVP